jgi:Flp pilus assembly protein TadG
VVADKAKMKAGIRRKRFGESARTPALLADAPFSAAVRQKAGGRLRREDGQALVEFAVVLPVLLMIVTGIIQFGLLFNKYITLTDAARNGAQTLAIGRGLSNPCDPAVLQTVQSGSATGLTAAQVTPSFSSGSDFCGTGTYTYNTSGNANGTEIQGDQATVTATQPFTLSVFGMGLVQMNLSASASDAVQ